MSRACNHPYRWNPGKERLPTVGATLIGANLRCVVPLRLPPPLWGRVGVGGRASGHSLAPLLDPHPRPLPTRGRGESAAPLQRKLAPMGATLVVAPRLGPMILNRPLRPPGTGRPLGSPLDAGADARTSAGARSLRKAAVPEPPFRRGMQNHVRNVRSLFRVAGWYSGGWR